MRGPDPHGRTPLDHLLPDTLFTPLPAWGLVLAAVVGLAVLGRGADWLIEGATDLAMRAGLPKVIIGATLLSLGTTAPECAVSVMAAVQGEPGLALGNAVGSVIFDTAVIFGVLSMFARLPADRFVLSRQGWWQFGSAAMLAVGTYGLYAASGETAVIPRWFGILLLVLLAIYMAMSVRWARSHPESGVQEMLEEGEHPDAAWKSVLWVFAGLALVLVAGRVTVASVSIAALRAGVPGTVVAGTFVALGTSLPELVVGLTALRRGHGEILVGNVIGADVLNVLFVVGAAATASPLPILEDEPPRYVFLTTYVPCMMAVLVYFRLCIARAVRVGSFDRWMGIPLVLAYLVYAVTQFTAG